MDNSILEVRALRADEIECRLQQCTEKGVVLLLYKDARCDMTVLDETFTPYGWQRKHELINGKEFCTVSIKSETGEWISKQDCGSESNTEKAKGETSDAFKRACVNWGIGRELYTKIFIFVKVLTVKSGSKWEMADKYAKFTVSNIETDNRAKKILKLAISDKNGKTVFTWDNNNPPKHEETEQEYNAPEYKCEGCGTPFKNLKAPDGTKYTAEDLYEGAKKKCGGKALCKKCQSEHTPVSEVSA